MENEEPPRIEATIGGPHYGLRDDLLMTIDIQPPRSEYVIKATGRIRDILKLINKTEWKAYRMEVDVDEFLEKYHSLDSTPIKVNENGQ